MRALPLLCLAGLLAACSKPGAPTDGSAPATGGAPAATSGDPIANALAAPGRLAEDLPQDVNRKPAEVLAFFGVKPGMTVLDMYSAGGYYTEILSQVVGPTGRVYAHNNTPYLGYSKDEIDKRYADPGRLANVERFTGENNALDLPDNKFDFVLMSMVYHDVYFQDEASGWERVDPPQMLAENSS
jgi:predicted methyltransferase